MPSPTRVTFLLGLLLSLIPVARASAQSCGAQLCASPSGACEVTTSCTLTVGTSDLLFDLGPRAFVIKANKALTIDGTGGITVYAGSIQLESGAKIFATGGPGNSGASVTLEATGPITLGSGTLIDVSSQVGGGLIGLRSGDAIQALGNLKATSAGGIGSGGNVSIDTFLDDGGDVTIGGAGIDTSAGTTESGGFIDVSAGGKITVSAPISARGGAFDGGSVTLAASGGDLLLVAGQGSINTTASGSGGGYGGDVDLTASGAVTIGGPVLASGAGGGGNGAAVELTAEDGGVTIGARIEVAGGTGGGSGGDVTVSGTGTITVAATILAEGSGTQASGGAVDLTTTGAISIFESIDVDGGWGGDITAVADGTLNVAATLSATGGAPAGLGGRIELQACNLTVQNAAVLNSSGPGTYPTASNTLEASGTMTVNGTLTAGTASKNRLEYRSVVPTYNPAKITPALLPADVAQNPGLPCCVGCPVTTTSSSTTSTTTSTTSTTTSSSTTTSITTTTSLPTTTSSSLVPTTTSSSVSSTSTSSSSTSTSTSSTTTSSTTSTSATTTSSTTTTSTTVDTTSTTVASSTTTTTRPSTTSTIVVTTSTTTTTLPLTCLDMPLEGFEAVDCRLGTLADTLSAQPPTDLGGTRSAKQLKVKVAKARKLVTTARGAKKPSVVLKRADRQLRAFDKVVGKMAARGKLASELRDRLIGLSQSTLAEIGVLRAG